MTNEEITKYIFLDDKNLESDIAFVFGTGKALRSSVGKAVLLYRAKTVPKIVFSGGVNRQTTVVEGDAMAEEAMKLGVARKDILVENRSANTLENVLFSIDVIDKEMGLQNIKSITAVMKNYHARRALMTLKKHLPQHIRLRAAPYSSDSYPFTREDWHQSELGRKKVLEEMEKIKTYLAKGDLAEL